MQSEIFKLDWKDVGKGLLIAVLTAVLTKIYDGLNSSLVIEWVEIGRIALISGIGYLIKNFLTDEDNNLGGINL